MLGILVAGGVVAFIFGQSAAGGALIGAATMGFVPAQMSKKKGDE